MSRVLASGRVPVANRVSLKFAQNLSTRSEDFTNPNWFKGDCSITANSIANPVDGLLTASTFVENSNNAAHYMGDNSLFSDNRIYTFSAYVKKINRNFAYISTASFNFIVYFDLVNGVVSQVSQNSNTNIVNSSIESLGNGWYRCSASFYTSFFGGGLIVGTCIVSGVVSYVGAGVNSMYVYGAQCNGNVVTLPYTPTANGIAVNNGYPRSAIPPYDNIMLYSEALATLPWTTYSVTNTNNTSDTTDPRGSNYATACVEIAANDFHSPLIQSLNIIAPRANCSVYAKAGTRNWIWLRDVNNSNSACYFDITNGVVGNVGASWTNPVITSVGNGWWRCSADLTNAATNRMDVGIASANGTNVYLGVAVVKAVYLWGAQMSKEYGVKPYVRTSVDGVFSRILTSTT